MKNSEVIEILNECNGICVRINDTGEWLEVTSAIKYAIKCVEMMPELVEALSEARDILLDDDTHSGYYWDDEVNKYKDIIQRAREGEE